LCALVREGFEVGDELQQRGTAPICQIDDLPGYIWSRHGQYIAVHDIVNIGKVARLLAVTIDWERLVFETGGDEFGITAAY